MRRVLLPIFLLAISVGPGSTQVAKEQPADKGAPRIAVVDIGRVFNSFVGSYRNRRDIDPSLLELHESARRLTKEIKVYEEALQAKDLPIAKAKEIQEGIAERKVRLEEANQAVAKATAKRQEENTLGYWNSAQQAISTCAKKRGFDIVFGYGEPIEELQNKFPNVKRKLEAMDLGSTVPLFVSSRVDITSDVLEELQKQRRERMDK